MSIKDIARSLLPAEHHVLQRFSLALKSVDVRFEPSDVVAALERDMYDGRLRRFVEGEVSALYCVVAERVADAASLPSVRMDNYIKFTPSLANTHTPFSTLVYAIRVGTAAGAAFSTFSDVYVGCIDNEGAVDEFISLVSETVLPFSEAVHEVFVEQDATPHGYGGPYRRSFTQDCVEASCDVVRLTSDALIQMRDEMHAAPIVINVSTANDILSTITCSPTGFAKAAQDAHVTSKTCDLFGHWLHVLRGRDAKEKCSGFYVTTNEVSNRAGTDLGEAVDSAARTDERVGKDTTETAAGSRIDFQMVPETYGPAQERDSWRSFEVSIRRELENADAPEIHSLLCVLQVCNGKLHDEFMAEVALMKVAAGEASNVGRYFPSVARCAEPLSEKDPEEAIATMADLITSVERLVHTVTYYRDQEHLTLLCLSLSNQVIVCAKAAIRRGGRVWDQADSIPLLRTMLRHFHATTELSRKLRDEVLQREVFRGLDELIVFGKLELFCNRLAKMRELFDCVLTYRILAEYHLEDIEGLLVNFFNAFEDLRRKSGDCLDYSKPAFDRDFLEFRKRIAESDRSLQVYVNFSFEKVTNTVASLQLLQKYQILMQRDSLKADLQAKYLIMFQRYGADVETIQRVYEQHKADPPAIRSAPPVVRRVMWARHLLRRLEEPMLIFQSCQSIVSHQRDISKVIRLYNRVALTLTKYESFYISAWTQSVGLATSGLHATVLVRDPETNALVVNFDSTLEEIVREARWMVLLGIELPPAAHTLLQHRFLPGQVAHLSHLVMWARRVRDSIDPLHVKALTSVISDLDVVFSQGLSTVTWSSASLGSFLDAASSSIARMEHLVNRVNGIVSCRIQPSMSQLRRTIIMIATTARAQHSAGHSSADRHNAPSDTLYTPDAFLSAQQEESERVSVTFAVLNDTVRQASIDLCQLIDPAWEPRPEVPGQDDCLTALYSHYNRQMFRAVLHSTVASLSALNQSIGSQVHIQARPNGHSFLKVDLELVSPEVILSPSLDELQGVINGCITAILGTSKSLGEWPHIRGAYSTSDSAPFFDEVSRNKEVMKTVLLLTGSMFGLRRQLSDFVSSFDRFSVLWLNDPKTIAKDFARSAESRSVGDFQEELDFCANLHGQLSILEEACDIGCIKVQCSLFKAKMSEAVTRWRYAYGNELNHYIETRVSHLQDIADDLHKRLVHSVSEDFERLPGEMETLRRACEWEWRTDSELVDIDRRLLLLEDHMVGHPFELADLVVGLRQRWRKIRSLATSRNHELSTIQFVYKRDLAASVKIFSTDIIAFRNNFENNGPLVAGVKARDGVERVKRFQRMLDDKYRRWEAHMAAEAIFRYKQHLYPELALTVKEMHMATRLYNLYSTVMTHVGNFRVILWKDLIYGHVVEELSGLQTELKRLPANLKTFEAFREAKKTVDLYLDLEQLMEQLSHKSVRRRHWEEIMKVCGKTFSVDPLDLKLGHVIDADLLPFRDEIIDIAIASEKEGEIESKLAATIREWKERELIFAEYKQRGPVVLKAEETAQLRDALEDAIVILGALLASKFIAPFRAEAHMWLQRLGVVSQSLALLLEVQGLWTYLEAVFAGGDIMKQLPHEAKRFAMVDKQWVKLMFKSAEIANTVDVCCGNDALKSLPYLKEQLEVCQRALSTYLEQKRNLFPRFYFISDAVLLEILSQGSDPNAVQSHLSSIFDGIARVTLQQTDDKRVQKIVKFHSSEGETVNMAEHVVCQGNVESWLEKLCTEMQRSVRVVLREAISEVDSTKGDSTFLKHFLQRFPSQIVLTALQIRYTGDVQLALDGQNNLRKDLSSVLVRTKEVLAEQARTVGLTEAFKTHIETLTTMAVHNLEVWEGSVKRAKNSEAFDWQKQLRFYWTDSAGCVLQIADANLWYCCEYLGIKERLVITPLTDRCYVTLSQALAMYMGGAPAGPAGTGKTETVKDLGRAAGKYVVVFNCSDQWDVRSLGKIFKGLAQSGSWGCFDEFNRITLSVLSVVAQQISTIFHALRQHRSEFVFTTGQVCKLNPAVGIFVTMNPGYAGRQELPENLKALFRGVSMMVPDRQVIMKTKLAACGYKCDATLSRKFNMLYLLCEQQLSDQRHYDFGLRNILSVLRSAGDVLRRAGSSDEEAVFMKCVRDINVSKLVHSDVPVFLSLLADIFPGKSPTDAGHAALDAAIRTVCSDGKVAVSDGFMLKCMQIYETKLVRHGIMVVGPASSGKTTCTTTLLSALNATEGKHREVRMNPKAITAQQMFGSMDAVTGDWHDGIFSFLWRRNNEYKFAIWMVCDGPVDTLWIESLNTVLDDNKLLTLANGDRILMAPTLKMCFEVENLANASPATVSRSGIVYVSLEDIGWQPVLFALVSGYVRRRQWTSQTANRVLHLARDHVPAILHDVLSTAKSYMGLSVQHTIQTLVQIADAMLKDAGGDADLPEVVADMTFWYAFAWAVGGALDSPDRTTIHQYIADNVAAEVPALPDENTIFDVYVNHAAARWEPWSEHVPSWSVAWDPTQSYVDSAKVFVPTRESTVVHSLLMRHFQAGTPAILVGAEGSAKTVTLERFLATHSHGDDLHAWSKVNISRATTPQMLQGSIDDLCEKRMGTLYGPKHNKRLSLFLDDLHMAETNEWGDQVTCELLRQIIEWGGLFSLNRVGEWRKYTDIVYFGSMTTSTTMNNNGSATVGATNTGIPMRLLRHFAVYTMPFPQDVTLKHIYQSILYARLGHLDYLRSFLPNVIEATLALWRACATTLLPTPTRFYYSFNLRDLSRLIQGLLMVPPSSVHSPLVLARLWHHESSRVLSDKLCLEEDLSFFNNRVMTVGHDYFGAEALTAEAPLVANFCRDAVIDSITGEESEEPLSYEVTEHSKTLGKLDMLMRLYNEQKRTVKVDIVLFEYALQHLLRIARILGTPRGSALLIGVGGSGKQSLTRLAAYTQRQQVFTPAITAQYTVINWLDDLRTRFVAAGTQGPTTYMITDAHIKEESFLEYINAALSSGDVPGLFTADERESARSSIRHIAKQTARRQFEDSEEWLWNFFLGRVRDNLHIVLCFSPEGPSFRRRVRQFPGILSSCTVNYFFPWPNSALCDVARLFINDVELSTTEVVKRNLPRVLADIHTRLTLLADDYHAKYRQRVYTTPEVYLTFLRCFGSLYQKKHVTLNASFAALTNGLQKLHEASEDVANMRVLLDKKEAALRAAQHETEVLLEEITVRTEAAEKQAADVQRVTDALSAEAARIATIREEAERDLMAAQPAVIAAREALDQITSSDIKTLKSMQRPPEMIRRIFDGVGILLLNGVDAVTTDMHRGKLRMVDSWVHHGRALCGSTDLLDRLRQFNVTGKDRVNDETCELLLPYIEQEDFTFERARIASGNIAGLCTWVRAMVAYRAISKFVAPKIDALNLAEANMKVANAKLAAQEAELAKVREALEACMTELRAAQARRDELEADAISTRRRVEYATALIAALADEKVRWKQQAQTFQSTLERLVGDVTQAAAFLTYGGPYNPDYRRRLLKDGVVNALNASKVPTSADFTVVRFMTDEQTVAGWQIEGLPMDDHSVQNALIVKHSTLYPLLVDPQGQAVAWLKCHLTDPALVAVPASDKQLLQALVAHMQDGTPLLVEDAELEKRDPLLTSAVERRVVKMSGHGPAMSILGEPYEFVSSFRLFLSTKNPRFGYEPEVFAKVAVIDFSVTMVGLEQQLLARVIQSERSELEQQKIQLAKEINENEKKLRDLEDALLQQLSAAEGSLVDDESLILTLQQSKSSASDIKDSLLVASDTRSRISAARQEYQPVSKRAAVLYFTSVEMSNVNACYQLSLDRFIDIFDRSMQKSPSSNSTAIRIKSINDMTTYLFFVHVGRGMFEAHKLLFSLLIALRIETQAGRIDDETVRLFAKGGSTLGQEELQRSHQKPFPWVLLSCWRNVVALANVPIFKSIAETFARNEAEFRTFIDSEAPEAKRAIPGYKDLTPFEWLCAVRCLREDRTLVAAAAYIAEVLGSHMVEVPPYDLDSVMDEVKGKRLPVMILLSPGSDPTALLEAQAKKVRIPLHQLSLGQGQEVAAMQLLDQARVRGEWAVFQNCHLGIPFLEGLIPWVLEDPAGDHPEFRIIITAAPAQELPTALLLRCLRLTNEPPEGMAPALHKVAGWIPADTYDMYRRPEWRPLVYSLCVTHALLLERRKYGARGWTGSYQFSQGDFQASLTYLQNHFGTIGEDTRWSPALQWDGIRYMVGDIHYGGRVTITRDRAVLHAMMERFLRPENLTPGQHMCAELGRFPIRDCADVNALRNAFAEDFSSDEPPQVVGLYTNAETQHRTRKTTALLQTMLSIQPRASSSAGASTRELAVLSIVDSTLKAMPQTFPTQYLHDAGVRLDPVRPLTVYFLLEAARTNTVIDRASSLLRDLKQALQGSLGLSSSLSEIADALFSGLTPAAICSISWTATTFTSWVSQLTRRHEQIANHLRDGRCNSYNVSLLFNPQGFINSVRQDVCRSRSGWALDRAEPRFNVSKVINPADIERPPEEGVNIHGLLLDGAGWDVGKQRLKAPAVKETYREMPVIHVTAQLISQSPSALNSKQKNAAAEIMAQLMAGNMNITPSMFRLARAQRDADSSVQRVKVPCFVLPTRGDSSFVCDIDLNHDEEDPTVWTLRGIALLCRNE